MVSLICSVVRKKTSINEKLSFQLMIMKEGKIIYLSLQYAELYKFTVNRTV